MVYKTIQNAASLYTKPPNLAQTQPVNLEAVISGCSRLACKPTGQLRPLPSQLEFPFSFSFLYPLLSFHIFICSELLFQDFFALLQFLYVWSCFSKVKNNLFWWSTRMLNQSGTSQPSWASGRIHCTACGVWCTKLVKNQKRSQYQKLKIFPKKNVLQDPLRKRKKGPEKHLKHSVQPLISDVTKAIQSHWCRTLE